MTAKGCTNHAADREVEIIGMHATIVVSGSHEKDKIDFLLMQINAVLKTPPKRGLSERIPAGY